LFVANGRITIDLGAASIDVQTLAKYPKGGGSLGEVRGKHFEKQVQTAIDASGWKPSSFKEYVGKEITANGKNISDIDALAERDGTIILIDCMSAIVDQAYWNNDERSMDNYRTRCEKKLHKWNDICDRLRREPKGDNYNLSMTKQIVPLICVPWTLLLPIGPCTAEVLPGL
jgi:hypothetical protein